MTRLDEVPQLTNRRGTVECPVKGGGRQIAFSGIWFDDELIRSQAGWKIRRRRETLAWRHAFPEAFEVPKP